MTAWCLKSKQMLVLELARNWSSWPTRTSEISETLPIPNWNQNKACAVAAIAFASLFSSAYVATRLSELKLAIFADVVGGNLHAPLLSHSALYSWVASKFPSLKGYPGFSSCPCHWTLSRSLAAGIKAGDTSFYLAFLTSIAPFSPYQTLWQGLFSYLLIWIPVIVAILLALLSMKCHLSSPP